MSSKAKKDRLKRGHIFIPMIFSFGATLEDMPIDIFLDDPTKISNTLRLIQGFLGTDGVVCYADQTLLARALGCRVTQTTYPPIVERPPQSDCDTEALLEKLLDAPAAGAALEVTRRLGRLLPETVLLGSVPGPITVATQISGYPVTEVLGSEDLMRTASRASLAFAKATGDAGADILVVRETEIPKLDPQSAKLLSRSLVPIWNTAKFYDLAPLLMVDCHTPENVPFLQRLVDMVCVPIERLTELPKPPRRLSLSLPVDLLVREPEEITSILADAVRSAEERGTRLFLLTTQTEIPNTIDKELMIRGVRAINDYLLSRRI